MKADDSLVDTNSSVADITVDNGFNFGPATRTGAWLFAAFGLYGIYMGGGGIFFGVFLLLAAIFALTSKHGVQISLSNNYIREYSSVFGIKSGKWKSTLGLTDITVIKLGKKIRMGNFLPAVVATPVGSIEIDASVNEVYLLTADHRKRILVKVCKSAKEGFEFAKEISSRMGKNLVNFNPKISEATKAMKARR
jgi:hypothetical protein